MSEIVTIGIAYDTSKLVTGTRQVETELRKLEQAERATAQQAAVLERSVGSTGRALQQEASSASQATSAVGAAGQAAGGAATQHDRLERQATEAAGAMQKTAQAASQATDNLQKTSQATGGAANTLDRLTSKLGAFGQQVGSFAIAQAGVSSLQAVLQSALGFAQASVQAAVQTQSLAAAFKAIEGSSQAANSTLTFLRSTADRLGVNFATLATGFRTVDAAARGTSLQGQGIRDVFVAMAEASRVLGLSSQDLNGILLAVGQSISKGTVQAEELRGQIGERLPGAVQIAARAMGVTTAKLGEMMEAGELQLGFWPKFADQIKKEFGGGVAEASQQAGAALERFNNSMNDMKIAAGQTILPTLTWMINNFNAVAGAIGKATAALEGYSKAQKQAMEEARTAAGETTQPGLTQQYVEARAEEDRLRGARRAAQQITGQDSAQTLALLEKEQAAQAKALAILKEIEAVKKRGAPDPLGEGGATEPGARDERRVKFLETVTKLEESYTKTLERQREVMKATLGRAPTQEEQLTARQDVDKEVQKAIKGQEDLLALYKDNPAVKALRDQMAATEALDKAIDKGKEDKQKKEEADRKAEAQAQQDAQDRLADTKRVGQAVYDADRDAIDLHDELLRKTEALMFTEEERLQRRVAQIGKEHAAHKQLLDDALALYQAEKQRDELLKERDKRLKDEASTSASYLSDLQKLEKQLEPSRRRQTTAQRHADTLTELEARTKPEDRDEVMARARKKSADTLAWEKQQDQLEQLEEVGNRVLSNLTDAIEKFTQTGKFSFKEMIDSMLADFMRFSMQSLTKMATESTWWQELMKAATGLMGSTGTTSTGTGGSGGYDFPGASGGGSFAGGDAPGMQHGGPAYAYQPYTVGEAGPELFIPRSNGVIVPNNTPAPSSGSTVHMTVVTSDADSFRRSRSQIAADMTKAAKQTRRVA